MANKDISSNSVAVGNPCNFIKKIFSKIVIVRPAKGK